MNDDWKTPEIRDAEAMLEERFRQAEETLAQAEELNANLPEITLDEERVEEIEGLIRNGSAPPEVAALQQRIDDGELSWQDIANGTALHDESVQEALGSGVQNMRHAKELLDEGHDVATVVDSDPNRAHVDDDDDDGQGSFLR